MEIKQIESPAIVFHPANYKAEVGRLYLCQSDGKLHFDGDMAESARIFIDFVNQCLCAPNSQGEIDGSYDADK